jgi:uncharacterized protein (DUF305 family)
MPLMLTEKQLAQLAAAGGATFDRLFLQLMIQHHAGALVMVEQLRASGGGVEAESYTFSAEVEANQRIEIARVQELQADFDTASD